MNTELPNSGDESVTEFTGLLQEFSGEVYALDDPRLEPRRRIGRPASPGDELKVRPVKQGVAYLDNGTMVVIEQGDFAIDQEATLIVTKVLRTAEGRVIFGRIENRSSKPTTSDD